MRSVVATASELESAVQSISVIPGMVHPAIADVSDAFPIVIEGKANEIGVLWSTNTVVVGVNVGKGEGVIVGVAVHVFGIKVLRETSPEGDGQLRFQETDHRVHVSGRYG